MRDIYVGETPPPIPTWASRPHAQPAKRRGISLNILLFLVTILTTLIGGATLSGVDLLAHPELVYRGFPFSIALMSILLSHELGHYLMSRKHNVEATLPFFIPAPTIIGTFGAVIKIKSRVPDRRALLDIGAAGPIVGFIVSIPVLIIGLKLSEATLGTGGGMTFGSSLLSELLARWAFPSVPEGYVINLHPVALAGWLGLLVTMMNLLPIGMMDGGHIAYALFGRWHRRISRAGIAAMLVMGFVSWPGWAVWGAVNLLFGLRHPPPVYPDIPLDPKRKLVAAFATLILVLTFIPTPISLQ